ncbi:uncharacterized protein DFL_008090 [Arthrobotrys flagrans]|uniref:Uncharacterized protein n=1 Tax=Arthrobotrys flagrans TaxID=97331 RepID=A0A436ZMU8_ARTFL|nr:hypothetical protein DFL_008090 [Arthrobotrys flagrans]
MCHGHSSRQSEGGAIAILRGQGRQSGTLFNAKITLKNPEEDIPTQATFLFEKANRIPSLGSCTLIIHQDGNLNYEDTSREPLHHIPFDLYEDHVCEVSLPSRLDLGVGGQGVIGRKMSLMNSRQVIAQGIIGWN